MSDRSSEARWVWRLLALDLLLAVAEKVGVDALRMGEVRERARRLRELVDRL